MQNECLFHIELHKLLGMEPVMQQKRNVYTVRHASLEALDRPMASQSPTEGTYKKRVGQRP